MRSLSSLVALVVLVALGACAPAGARPELPERVELVLLHTADTHSQLFPKRALLSAADARRGLGGAGELHEVGGFARLASVLGWERRKAERVLYLDSGDLFQGSLAFERFSGEPELLAFDALRVDAQALGNHELDRGAELVRERYETLATFPLLAANYAFDGGGGVVSTLAPFALLDAGGLRVGVIGVGNVGSVALLAERPSELGVLARDAAGAVQGAVDELRPFADVIVLLTHLGLDADEELVARTSGVDVVLGGHQHLTLDAPVWVWDCGNDGAVRDAWGVERACVPRRVPIVHSGAYGRFVGRLRLTLDDARRVLVPGVGALDGYELAELDFALLPVAEDVPEDPGISELLAPYEATFAERRSGIGLVAFAPAAVERAGVTSGDSPLGNLVAEAARRAALAELAIVGASSLRHDLPPGLIDQETLKRVLPFEDPVVRVHMSGAALSEAFEHAETSASRRDCRTQVHVAGALVRFACACAEPPCARVWVHETAVACYADGDCAAFGGACDALGRCRTPVSASDSYEVATTAYLADGGSGLLPAAAVAGRVTVSDTLATAVRDWLEEGSSVSSAPAVDDEACARAVSATLDDGAHARAVAICRELPRLDAAAGAVRDGRIRFEAP